MRWAIRSIGLMVGCIGVGGFCLLFLRPGPPSVATVCPGASTKSQGVSAILPQNNCTPALTAQAARAYVGAHLSLGHMTSEGTPTITSVVFTTVQGAETWSNISVDGSPNLVICVVMLQGTFSVYAPGGGAVVGHSAYVVFDAHTGNQIEVGMGE